MNVLSRVKTAAATHGLSVEKLSEEVTKKGTKLSKSTIYKWDKSEPNAEKIRAVADVLGVSVDYLLGNTDEMYPTNSKNQDDLQPEDIVVLNKIRTAGLNDEQLQKLDDYIEFLKYDYIKEMQDDK